MSKRMTVKIKISKYIRLVHLESTRGQSNQLWVLPLLLIVFHMVACRQAPPPFQCSDAIGCVDIQPGAPLELGVMQALSGGAATIGDVQLKTIQLAIEQHGNQIAGHPITLHVENSKCSAEAGSIAALKMVANHKILAVLGPTCSAAAKEASRIISIHGLSMISGSTGAPSLTSVAGKKGADWQPGYFRTMPNDEGRGRVAAIVAYRKLGVSKVAMVNDGDLYTRGLTSRFKKAFMELDGDIVLDATINKGEKDMMPVLTAIAAREVELLFFPVFQPEGGLLVQKISQAPGMHKFILMSNESMLLDDFIKNGGPAVARMYFISSHSPKGPGIDKLIEAYAGKYGGPPQHGSFCYMYDATNLLLNAIEKTAIRENNGTLHIGRQALRDELYATSGVVGGTGILSCDSFGDCSTGKFDILRVDDPAAGCAGVRANVIYTFNAVQTQNQGFEFR